MHLLNFDIRSLYAQTLNLKSQKFPRSTDRLGTGRLPGAPALARGPIAAAAGHAESLQHLHIP